MEQIGIDDDFYELGGDSLGSIERISDANLPGLNANMIFRGRTPKRNVVLREVKPEEIVLLLVVMILY